MNDIFAEISKRIEDKKLVRTALSLYKNFRPTKANQLERNFHFVSKLYFKNYKNETIDIINKIQGIEFNGNYNIWSFVQPLLFLKCWIIKDIDDKEVIKIVDRIKETFNYGNDELAKKVNKRVSERSLRGEHLYYLEIENAINNNDKQDEKSYRICQFYRLLYIYFLGGSNEFTKERAEKEIKENEELIKNLK